MRTCVLLLGAWLGAATAAAAAVGDDGAALLEALRDGAATRRRTACEQLTPESLPPRAAARVLARIERLCGSDADPRVRVAAAAALGRCGGGGARSVLFAVAERDPDPEVADTAALALGRLADDGQVAQLLSLLGTGPIRRRLIAARALGATADPRVREALRFALAADPHGAVRAAAALGLGGHADVAICEVLLARLQSDRDHAVRTACAEALRATTGLPHGNDPEAWNAARDAGTLRPGAVAPDPAPSRDRYADPADPAGGRTITYWGLTLVPDGTLFCVDVSGSMMSFERLVMARRELRSAVAQMDSADRFGVLFFNHAQWLWGERLLPANPFTKWMLAAYADQVEAKGYTDLLGMFETAFGVGGVGRCAVSPPERLRQLCVLTDGTPSRNFVQDLDLIRRRVREWNPAARVRVHTVGLGSSDSAFLAALAGENRGRFLARDGG